MLEKEGVGKRMSSSTRQNQRFVLVHFKFKQVTGMCLQLPLHTCVSTRASKCIQTHACVTIEAL